MSLLLFFNNPQYGPVTATDLGNGVWQLSGDGVIDLGNGIAQVAGSNVVDNGNGTGSITTADGGNVKVWTGSAWTPKPVKVWTGSIWAVKPAKVWTGSVWKTTTY